MKEGQKGLITDFDNTLVKTMRFVSNHIRETCEVLGIRCPSQERLLAILKLNPPFEKIFQDIFAESANEVLTKYRETAIAKFFKPIDDGLEFVKILNQKDILIVIVSNRINKLPERLEQAGYNPNSFLAIVQPDKPKPNKEAYSEAIRILNENGAREENIFIAGDSLDDYEACPNHLAKHFFALLTGPNTKEEFMKAGVEKDKILTSFSNLPDLILNHGGN